MISASKFHRTQQRLFSCRKYISKLEQLIVKCGNHYREDSFIRNQKPCLLIIISSDRGLCGSFNNIIAKYSKAHINSLISCNQEVKLCFFGKKAYEMMKSMYKNNVIGVFLDTKIIVDIHSFKKFLYKTDINLDNFECIEICYNKFYSTISQKPCIDKIVPLKSNVDDEKTAIITEDIFDHYQYEPNKNDLSISLKENYLVAWLYAALLESATSEHCARMMAMESANNNTKDMLDNLILSYNRSRQSAITTDLIEVISGFEALFN